MDLAPDDNVEETEVERAEPIEPRLPSFVLTKWDLDILRLIWQHRFLRREQLAILTSRSPKKLHERLLPMTKRGYLKALKFPLQQHVYTIAKEGSAL
ncbi:MAG: hypothetical protein JNK87_39040 [Bryobacterales bacterium]|nr:hypothetical protein [Bryobacterales bacterium]